jgi:hypothetical protein
MSAASFYFTGVGYGMVPDTASETWYAYVGLPTWFTIGGYPIEVWTGETLLAAGWLDVTEGGFDFTEITLPPGPAGLLSDTARVEAERQRVSRGSAAALGAGGLISSNFGGTVDNGGARGLCSDTSVSQPARRWRALNSTAITAPRIRRQVNVACGCARSVVNETTDRLHGTTVLAPIRWGGSCGARCCISQRRSWT